MALYDQFSQVKCTIILQSVNSSQITTTALLFLELLNTTDNSIFYKNFFGTGLITQTIFQANCTYAAFIKEYQSVQLIRQQYVVNNSTYYSPAGWDPVNLASYFDSAVVQYHTSGLVLTQQTTNFTIQSNVGFNDLNLNFAMSLEISPPEGDEVIVEREREEEEKMEEIVENIVHEEEMDVIDTATAQEIVADGTDRDLNWLNPFDWFRDDVDDLAAETDKQAHIDYAKRLEEEAINPFDGELFPADNKYEPYSPQPDIQLPFDFQDVWRYPQHRRSDNPNYLYSPNPSMQTPFDFYDQWRYPQHRRSDNPAYQQYIRNFMMRNLSIGQKIKDAGFNIEMTFSDYLPVDWIASRLHARTFETQNQHDKAEIQMLHEVAQYRATEQAFKEFTYYNYITEGAAGRFLVGNNKQLAGHAISAVTPYALGALGMSLSPLGMVGLAIGTNMMYSYLDPVNVIQGILNNQAAVLNTGILNQAAAAEVNPIASGIQQGKGVDIILTQKLLQEIDAGLTAKDIGDLLSGSINQLNQVEAFIVKLQNELANAQAGLMGDVADIQAKLARAFAYQIKAQKSVFELAKSGNIQILNSWLEGTLLFSKAVGGLAVFSTTGGDGRAEFTSLLSTLNEQSQKKVMEFMETMNAQDIGQLHDFIIDVAGLQGQSYKQYALRLLQGVANNPYAGTFLKAAPWLYTGYGFYNWFSGDVADYKKNLALGNAHINKYLLRGNATNLLAIDNGDQEKVLQVANQIANSYANPDTSNQRHLQGQIDNLVNKKLSNGLAFTGPRSGRAERSNAILAEEIIKLANASQKRMNIRKPHWNRSSLLYPNSKNGLIGKRFMPHDYNANQDLKSFYDQEEDQKRQKPHVQNWLFQERRSFQPTSDVDYQAQKRQDKMNKKRNVFFQFYQ